MTKLMKLWRDYSSQEMFGESLRAEDPETFDELDAAITEADAREPLVQEVKRAYETYLACALEGREDPSNEEAALFEALSKLTEWKP